MVTVPDPQIQEAIAAVARLNDELTAAYQAGDTLEVERLLAEMSAAERRRNRLLQRTIEGPVSPPALPVREQVSRVLRLLARPAAVSLIRDVAAARFGDTIAGPRLASLRRDEHRSWRSATDGGQRAVSRPVYVVPALTYDRFGPMRGILALSSFPLELRLVAPASPRVDMLHMIDRLAAEVEHSPDAAWALDLRRLLWRLGRTVPGGEGADPAALRQAVAAELQQVDRADSKERAAAAKRAQQQLDEERLLFGSRFGEPAKVSDKASEA